MRPWRIGLVASDDGFRATVAGIGVRVYGFERVRRVWSAPVDFLPEVGLFVLFDDGWCCLLREGPEQRQLAMALKERLGQWNESWWEEANAKLFDSSSDVLIYPWPPGSQQPLG